MITLLATAYRANNTLSTNWLANKQLRRQLYQLGATGINEVVGSYKEEGEDIASQEISFKFQVADQRTARKIITIICTEYKQDSVLLINGGLCHLVSFDGSYLQYNELGCWHNISKQEALEKECYTLDKAGLYWLAK